MPHPKKAPLKSLNKKAIGQNLRLVRMQKGFTQVDIAARLDLTQNGYSKIETGHTHLTLDMLACISHLYEMQFEELTSLLVRDNFLKADGRRCKGKVTV